jgi:hypothetical protein
MVVAAAIQYQLKIQGDCDHFNRKSFFQIMRSCHRKKVVRERIKKYKYYTFMDNSDIYYTTFFYMNWVGKLVRLSKPFARTFQYPEPRPLHVGQSSEEPSHKRLKADNRVL